MGSVYLGTPVFIDWHPCGIRIRYIDNEGLYVNVGEIPYRYIALPGDNLEGRVCIVPD